MPPRRTNRGGNGNYNPYNHNQQRNGNERSFHCEVHGAGNHTTDDCSLMKMRHDLNDAIAEARLAAVRFCLSPYIQYMMLIS